MIFQKPTDLSRTGALHLQSLYRFFKPLNARTEHHYFLVNFLVQSNKAVHGRVEPINSLVSLVNMLIRFVQARTEVPIDILDVLVGLVDLCTQIEINLINARTQTLIHLINTLMSLIKTLLDDYGKIVKLFIHYCLDLLQILLL